MTEVETLVPRETPPDRPAKTVKRRNGWQVVWSNGKARTGIVILALFVAVAVCAPVIAPFNPKDSTLPPGLQPGGAYVLGTTNLGQDIFSQLVYGAQVSLIVGLLAGVVVTLIALVIGLVAGLLQGVVDEILSFSINLALVVPALPLMVTIAAYSPVHGLSLIIFVIALTGWAWGARMKRAQVLLLRSQDFVTAARFSGDGLWRIVFRELVPNMVSLVVAGFMGAAIGAIGAEAGLSFLGLGDPSTVSWGSMSYWANSNGAMLTGQWAWLLAPGLALSLLITALTLINFGIDALSNPQLREE
jgi:peptide/nickel transport system permease protein